MATLRPTDLGLPPAKGQINLSTKRAGFEWEYRWDAGNDSVGNPVPFPVGSKLYISFEDDSIPVWDFKIEANKAKLRLKPAEVAKVSDRTGFTLTFEMQDAEPRDILIGAVKRWEPR